MYGNSYQGGYAPQSGKATKPKKDKINQWEGIGIVSARGRNQEIKVFPFANGGGAIHINLCCTEFTGLSDENGNPKTKTTYIPVSVYANKNITIQQLQGVVPGMKVRVVGRIGNQVFDDKQTGQKRSTLNIEAYVFEVLEMPMQQPVQAQYPQQAYAPQGYVPQYQPQPGYAPQAATQPQAPAYPQQGGYAPQPQPNYPPQYAPQPQAPAAPQAAPVPPYYQGGAQSAPAPTPAPSIDDLPPANI